MPVMGFFPVVAYLRFLVAVFFKSYFVSLNHVYCGDIINYQGKNEQKRQSGFSYVKLIEKIEKNGKGIDGQSTPHELSEAKQN
jgi:hypothetical protein